MSVRRNLKATVLNETNKIKNSNLNHENGGPSSKQRKSHSSSSVFGTWHSDILPLFPEMKEKNEDAGSENKSPDLRQRSMSRDALDGSAIYAEPDRRHTVDASGMDVLKEKSHLDNMSVLVHTAIMNDDLEGLKQVYKHRRINLVDRNGNTPLHLAARKGNPQIIKWLIKSGFIPVDAKNERKETCAHHAVKLGQTKALKMIVYNGTIKPMTIACERDRHGMTILHLAAILGNHEVISWLVDAFGRTLSLIRNDYGQCALHFAAAKGHVKSVYCLCRLGKQAANVRDGIGATPALYASQEGHTQCLYYLANTAKADLTSSTDSGITPLMSAVQSGHVEAIRLILQRADGPILDRQAHDGSTAFHVAAANGQSAALKVLLAQEGSSDAVRICDARGSSPVHDAAQNGHVTCLRLLIEQGLDIHHRDEDGETPYALALRSDNAECVTYAKSFTDDRVIDPTSIYTRVQSTVVADEVNRSSKLDNSKIMSHQDKEKKNNDQGSSKRTKAKKLGFKKKSNTSVEQEPERNVLRGEFVLREHPLSERDHKTLQQQGAILSKMKFRPVPFRFPHLDEIEKDIELARSDDRYKRSLQESYHYPNGNVSMFPDPKVERPPHRQSFGLNSITPLGFNGRSHSSVGTDQTVGNSHSPFRGNTYMDRNHNRWEQTPGLNHSRADSVSSMIRSLESLDVNKPNFVGAFREDALQSQNYKKKYAAPPPPSRPVAPPRKKKEKRKQKRKSKDDSMQHGDHIYEEANDIDDVVNELHDLYSSNINKSSSAHSDDMYYMEWPENGTSAKRNQDLYQMSFPQSESGDHHFGLEHEQGYSYAPAINTSRSQSPEPPMEPPTDYSPLMKTKSFEVHVGAGDSTPASPNINRQLPALPNHSVNNTNEVVAEGEAPLLASMTVIALAPPPPPPPPPLADLERKPSVPLARDLITQKSQLRKTQTNRKPRARTRADHNNKGSVSSRVGEIRDQLEDKGLSVDCYVNPARASSSSMGDESSSIGGIYQNAISFGSSDDENSPETRRELSPASRFTYLPNGVLTKPNLRKVRTESSLIRMNSGRGSFNPKHTVSFQVDKSSPTRSSTRQKDEDNRVRTASDASASSMTSAEYDESSHAMSNTSALPRVRHSLRKKLVQKRQSLGLDIDDDDYHKLQTTLRMHLEKPKELPVLNMKAVRQYEKVPDPPSELELFFKRRREKLSNYGNDTDMCSNHGSSLYANGGDTGSITAISKLVETEALVARQET